MAENNKKRGGSFRKLFPNLFFSFKSKEKNTKKDSQTDLKSAAVSPKGNQYQNPRRINPDKVIQTDDSERIYENLSVHVFQSDNETQNNELSSQHSSSSTLVSEGVKDKTIKMNETTEANSFTYKNHAARPQVPPKPCDTSHFPQTANQITPLNAPDQYPDVYYHSLEKLSNKISPLDEMQIYRASQAQTNPASVGAEIKRVSTKFLISPKKEAEVRTIQPTRARSLSFDNKQDSEKDMKFIKRTSTKEENNRKPYNYSAPTSPIPISHKMPNMPKTISPYQHIRRTMIENEEKRNSLSRTSVRNKLAPSPRPGYGQRFNTDPTLKDSTKHDSIDREKTRQTVEAFYWQKLKELKQKEDEYLIRHSLNFSKNQSNFKTNSNCSTPNSFTFTTEPRSCSLPHEKDFKSYNMNHPIYTSTPFARGAPERRTDTFIKSQTSYADPDIIYRNPDKHYTRKSPALQDQKMPICYRESDPLHNRAMNILKRVSFDESCAQTDYNIINDRKILTSATNMLNRQVHHVPLNVVKVSETTSRVPPRPPVRTTSVGGMGKSLNLGNNKKNVHITGGVSHALCSESESGSEAGEIQRILHSDAQKGYAARHNTKPPFSVKKMEGLLKEACAQVTQEDWSKVVQKTKKIIMDDFERDVHFDNVMDNQLVINLNDDDDEDDDTSTSSE